MWLRHDVGQDFLDELRWHLGLIDEMPEVRTLRYDRPLLRPQPGRFPGGDLVSLIEHDRYLNHPPMCGLFFRRYSLDDEFHSVVPEVLPWLAEHSGTQGWVGCARDELSVEQDYQFYVQRGVAYLGGFLEHPVPLPYDREASPFTLRYTTDEYSP